MSSKPRRNRRSSNVSRAKDRLLVLATLLVLLTTGACGGGNNTSTANGETEAATGFEDVGPDWSIVQAYLDGKAGTSESVQDPAPNDEAPSEPPDINHAARAARAIVDQDGFHEKTVDAAEFLVNLLEHYPPVIMEADTDENVVAGARALAAHAPDFDGWPQALSQMNIFKRFRPDGTSSRQETDVFLEEMAQAASSPLLRAAARYYLADALVQAANLAEASPASREASRTRAEELAAGLSAGLEDRVFAGSTEGGSMETYPEAEAFLLRTIRHATIGGTLPDLTGVLLDGTKDRLSDYQDRVLLIDFWATWCKPCVEALPKLRELAADSPDRFAVLSTRVAKDRKPLPDSQADEPMPWANWHDPNHDVVAPLAVRSYPTYILADEDGQILARNNALDEKLLSMLEEATQAGSTD